MKRSIYSTFLSAGFVVALGSLCGCATSINSVEPAQASAPRQMISDKRLLSDPSLDRKVRIIGLNEALTPGGLLKVNVAVENMRRSVQQFNYRVDWLDQSGMPVETPNGVWIHREILGRETLDLTALAPTPNAKDYRIKFVEDIR